MNQGSEDFLPDDAYTPQQGEVKRRRSRKRVKSESVSSRKRKLRLEQVSELEVRFGSERKLESKRKDRIAAELGLDPRQVAVWFQNRRARWKAQKLEEEFSKLKSIHSDALLHKCHLESQVRELKEQLAEAERKIGRLQSPRSAEVQEQCQFYGNGFVMEGFDDFFYGAVQDYVYASDLWI